MNYRYALIIAVLFGVSLYTLNWLFYNGSPLITTLLVTILCGILGTLLIIAVILPMTDKKKGLCKCGHSAYLHRPSCINLKCKCKKYKEMK